MAGIPRVERAEIDKLAQEWCKAKHIIVMIDDVGRQFATDVANLVLKNYLEGVIERVAAKKAAAEGRPVEPAATNLTPPSAVKKSSLVLTDL